MHTHVSYTCRISNHSMSLSFDQDDMSHILRTYSWCSMHMVNYSVSINYCGLQNDYMSERCGKIRSSKMTKWTRMRVCACVCVFHLFSNKDTSNQKSRNFRLSTLVTHYPQQWQTRKSFRNVFWNSMLFALHILANTNAKPVHAVRTKMKMFVYFDTMTTRILNRYVYLWSNYVYIIEPMTRPLRCRGRPVFWPR